MSVVCAGLHACPSHSCCVSSHPHTRWILSHCQLARPLGRARLGSFLSAGAAAGLGWEGHFPGGSSTYWQAGCLHVALSLGLPPFKRPRWRLLSLLEPQSSRQPNRVHSVTQTGPDSALDGDADRQVGSVGLPWRLSTTAPLRREGGFRESNGRVQGVTLTNLRVPKSDTRVIGVES